MQEGRYPYAEAGMPHLGLSITPFYDVVEETRKANEEWECRKAAERSRQEKIRLASDIAAAEEAARLQIRADRGLDKATAGASVVHTTFNAPVTVSGGSLSIATQSVHKTDEQAIAKLFTALKAEVRDDHRTMRTRKKVKKALKDASLSEYERKKIEIAEGKEDSERRVRYAKLFLAVGQFALAAGGLGPFATVLETFFRAKDLLVEKPGK